MNEVKVHFYDTTNGLLDKFFVPKCIIGKKKVVWHTGICIFGKEIFYGGGIRICNSDKGITEFGEPIQIESYGKSNTSLYELEKFLISIENKYTDENYDIYDQNCNHFANELLYFLTNKELPEYILKQTQNIKKSCLSPIIRYYFDDKYKV